MGLTSEWSRGSRKKQLRWTSIHSNTHGFSTSLRQSASEVSPSTSLSGNSRLPSTTVLVIDAPGPRDFIKNMITITCQVDCVVLIIESTIGERRSDEGTCSARTQSRCHTDDLQLQQDGCHYTKILQAEVRRDRTVRYNPDKIAFVPISEFEGDNMIRRRRLAWFWCGDGRLRFAFIHIQICLIEWASGWVSTHRRSNSPPTFFPLQSPPPHHFDSVLGISSSSSCFSSSFLLPWLLWNCVRLNIATVEFLTQVSIKFLPETARASISASNWTQWRNKRMPTPQSTLQRYGRTRKFWSSGCCCQQKAWRISVSVHVQ